MIDQIQSPGLGLGQGNAKKALKTLQSIYSAQPLAVRRSARRDLLASAAPGDLGAFGWWLFDRPGNPHKPARHHEEWIEALNDLTVKRIFIAVPRGHAKTSWVGNCYTLWRLARERNLRIGYISCTEGQAEGVSVLCKNVIENDADFKALFPQISPDYDRKWTNTNWYIKRDFWLKDPTMFACGFGGPVIGKRFDELIIDDLNDQENTSSPTQREKVLDWMMQTVYPAVTSRVTGDEDEPKKQSTEDGRIIIIMTRWHERDLFHWAKDIGGFHFIIQPALGHWEMRKGLIVLSGRELETYPGHEEDENKEVRINKEQFGGDLLEEFSEVPGRDPGGKNQHVETLINPKTPSPGAENNQKQSPDRPENNKNNPLGGRKEGKSGAQIESSAPDLGEILTEEEEKEFNLSLSEPCKELILKDLQQPAHSAHTAHTTHSTQPAHITQVENGSCISMKNIEEKREFIEGVETGPGIDGVLREFDSVERLGPGPAEPAPSSPSTSLVLFGKKHLMEHGSPLWPEKTDMNELRRIAAVNPRMFQRMYQQDPVMPEGNIFSRGWWGCYDSLPESREFMAVIHSWDTAFSESAEADYSAGVMMGITRDGRIFVFREVREKMIFPVLKRAVVRAFMSDPIIGEARRTGNHSLMPMIVVERKTSGLSLVQALQFETMLPIDYVDADSSKISRAEACTWLVESGRVFLPNPDGDGAMWVREFVDELADFPNAAHDDRVDAFCHGLRYIMKTVLLCEEDLLRRVIGEDEERKARKRAEEDFSPEEERVEEMGGEWDLGNEGGSEWSAGVSGVFGPEGVGKRKWKSVRVIRVRG